MNIWHMHGGKLPRFLDSDDGDSGDSGGGYNGPGDEDSDDGWGGGYDSADVGEGRGSSADGSSPDSEMSYEEDNAAFAAANPDGIDAPTGVTTSYEGDLAGGYVGMHAPADPQGMINSNALDSLMGRDPTYSPDQIAAAQENPGMTFGEMDSYLAAQAQAAQSTAAQGIGHLDQPGLNLAYDPNVAQMAVQAYSPQEITQATIEGVPGSVGPGGWGSISSAAGLGSMGYSPGVGPGSQGWNGHFNPADEKSIGKDQLAQAIAQHNNPEARAYTDAGRWGGIGGFVSGGKTSKGAEFVNGIVDSPITSTALGYLAGPMGPAALHAIDYAIDGKYPSALGSLAAGYVGLPTGAQAQAASVAQNGWNAITGQGPQNVGYFSDQTGLNSPSSGGISSWGNGEGGIGFGNGSSSNSGNGFTSSGDGNQSAGDGGSSGTDGSSTGGASTGTTGTGTGTTTGTSTAGNDAYGAQAFDWFKDRYSDLGAERTKVTSTADAARAQQSQAQTLAMAGATSDRNRYDASVVPIQDKIFTDAMAFDGNGEANRLSQEAKAGVTKSFGEARQNYLSRANAMPGSQFTQATLADMDVSEAAAKAAQMNKARITGRELGTQKLYNAASLGAALPGQSQAGLNLANAAGTSATQTATIPGATARADSSLYGTGAQLALSDKASTNANEVARINAATGASSAANSANLAQQNQQNQQNANNAAAVGGIIQGVNTVGQWFDWW